MELKQSRSTSDIVERKEKIEKTLARLQSLKLIVSELRLQLETLNELQPERQEKPFLCTYCEKETRKGTEIMIKGFNGEVKKYYHEACFKVVLSS